MWLLTKDAWHTNSWKDKLRIWFMPTGWRPADVSKKFPVYKIEDVYHFNKYGDAVSKTFTSWIWVQLIVLLLLISYLFGNIAAIGSPGIFIYGGFIFIYVYALTELMDKNPHAVWYELIRCIAGGAIIYYYGDWFGISAFFPLMKFLLLSYLIISLLVTSWFSYRHRMETNNEFSLAVREI